MTTTAVAPRPVSSQEIKSALSSVIAADRILIRPIDLIAFASDARFYRLIPKAVVQARSQFARATRLEAIEIKAKPPDECYSSSRTCEIGMTRATGQVYRSYLYLLEKATL